MMIFSYYTKVRVPKLVRRPWWVIFGRDTIEMVDTTQRNVTVLSNVSEVEAVALLNGRNQQILQQIIGGTHWQLEVGGPATNYIPTSGSQMICQANKYKKQ